MLITTNLKYLNLSVFCATIHEGDKVVDIAKLEEAKEIAESLEEK